MSIKISDLKVGDKVTYNPLFNGTHFEHGIVKEIKESVPNGVFVVYNCAGEWDRYKEYTGALTNLEDLKRGWI